MAKNKLIVAAIVFLIIVLTAAVITLAVLYANEVKDGSSEVRRVDILVYHPETGELIGSGAQAELSAPAVPRIELRDSSTGDLLTDNVGNSSYLDYMSLFVDDEGGAYKNRPWNTGWPTAPGVYDIMIVFNNTSLNGGDPNYYETEFAFTIKIAEEQGVETDKEITVGKSMQFTLGAGQSEYLMYNADKAAEAFNYEISANGAVKLEFAYGSKDNYLANTMTGSEFTGSYLTEFAGKYYLIISNISQSEATVTVRLDNITELRPQQTESGNITYMNVYKYAAGFTSGVSVTFNSYANILLEVYDSEYNKIAWTETLSEHELLFKAMEGEEYYIVVKNIDHTLKEIEIACSVKGTTVGIGENSVNKTSSKALLEFATKSGDFVYHINCGQDFIVYDSSHTPVSANDGGNYLLGGNAVYYIELTGDIALVSVTIQPESTQNTSGQFGNNGFILIEYTPARTSVYDVTGEGSDGFEWYNSELTAVNAYLTAGKTYYLKVYGNAGESYNINISRSSAFLQLNVGMTVSEGLYYFNISESGSYTVWVTCPTGVSAGIVVSDSDDVKRLEEQNIANDFRQIYLEKGLYTLDLSVTGGNEISIKIEYPSDNT